MRRRLRDAAWAPYQRPPRPATVLAPHVGYLQERAPRVGYSAQILFQELRHRGYAGSYDTVKLFVRPLRGAGLGAERALVRLRRCCATCYKRGKRDRLDAAHRKIDGRRRAWRADGRLAMIRGSWSCSALPWRDFRAN